jgi:ABC-type Mn2+/Zn2+ transport system ATPase subunit
LPTAALSMRDMAYWYVAGAPVLDAADLTVAPGEVVMVRGPNGSGKTTLLRLAAGVAAPRRGVVRRAAAVGYQPQTGEDPPPRMPSLSWLATVGRMRRDRGGTAALDVLDALGGVDAGQEMGMLSRGTVTKVLLAGALSGRPGLVLLDEPFAPLDAAARDAAAALIAAAAAGGAGVLLSDHHGAGDLVATRRVRISGHRIAEDAPAAEGGQWKIILRAAGGAGRELRVPAAQRDRTLLEALLRGEEVCGVEEIP